MVRRSRSASTDRACQRIRCPQMPVVPINSMARRPPVDPSTVALDTWSFHAADGVWDPGSNLSRTREAGTVAAAARSSPSLRSPGACRPATNAGRTPSEPLGQQGAAGLLLQRPPMGPRPACTSVSCVSCGPTDNSSSHPFAPELARARYIPPAPAGPPPPHRPQAFAGCPRQFSSSPSAGADSATCNDGKSQPPGRQG